MFLAIFGILLLVAAAVMIFYSTRNTNDGTRKGKRKKNTLRITSGFLAVLLFGVCGLNFFGINKNNVSAETLTVFPDKTVEKMSTPTVVKPSDGEIAGAADVSETFPDAAGKAVVDGKQLHGYQKLQYWIHKEGSQLVNFAWNNGILQAYGYSSPQQFINTVDALAQVERENPEVSFITPTVFGISPKDDVSLQDILVQAKKIGLEIDDVIGWTAKPQGEVLVNSGAATGGAADGAQTIVTYPMEIGGVVQINFDRSIFTPEDGKEIAASYGIKVKEETNLVSGFINPLKDFTLGEVAWADELVSSYEKETVTLTKDESYLSNKYGDERYIKVTEKETGKKYYSEEIINEDVYGEYTTPIVKTVIYNKVMNQRAYGIFEECDNWKAGMTSKGQWKNYWEEYEAGYTQTIQTSGGEKIAFKTTIQHKKITEKEVIKTETSTTYSYKEGSTQSQDSGTPSETPKPSESESSMSETDDTATMETSETESSTETSETETSSSESESSSESSTTGSSSTDSSTTDTTTDSSSTEELSQKSEESLNSGNPEANKPEGEPEIVIPQIEVGDDAQIVDNIENFVEEQQQNETITSQVPVEETGQVQTPADDVEQQSPAPSTDITETEDSGITTEAPDPGIAETISSSAGAVAAFAGGVFFSALAFDPKDLIAAAASLLKL